MTKRYTPPQQSSGGQIFDAVFLMVLVFLALFLPLWLKIAVPARERVLPDGETLSEAANADGSLAQTWEGVSCDAIGQNPEEQGQGAMLNETQTGRYRLGKVADVVHPGFNSEVGVRGRRQHKWEGG